MVDRREMLAQVGAQHVTIVARELLQAVDRPMRPLADAVGVAVGNENALEARFDDRAQGVVHHPVTKCRGADFPVLGFVNEEMGVRPGRVATVEQVRTQAQQAIGHLELEAGDGGSASLATGRALEGLQQVRPVAQFGERGTMMSSVDGVRSVGQVSVASLGTLPGKDVGLRPAG